MATIQLPPDFKEFLQLLNSYDVQYLIVGGYAVGYHAIRGQLEIWTFGLPSIVVMRVDSFQF